MSSLQRETDADVIERARRIVAGKQRVRWGMLLNALVFFGFAGFCTFAGFRKIEGIAEEQLTAGFVYGLTLAVVWTTFGLVGAIFLGKFLVGFNRDFRTQELLVQYHDRLRELGQLPDDKTIH